MTWTVPCGLRHRAYEVAQRFCWRDQRPGGMYQRGRHPVAVQDTELLFARWFSDHMDADGKPRAENLIAPDQSMNRSGLGGRCWYVLVPDPTDEPAKAMKTLCRGIVRVAAPDLSMQMVADGKVFTLRIEPDPLDHNYHHCELHLFRDGQRLSAREVRDLKGDDKKSWKAAKAWFRNRRVESLRLLLKSEVATGSA